VKNVDVSGRVGATAKPTSSIDRDLSIQAQKKNSWTRVLSARQQLAAPRRENGFYSGKLIAKYLVYPEVQLVTMSLTDVPRT